MISQDLLAILRCPLSPSKTRLKLLDGERLVCCERLQLAVFRFATAFRCSWPRRRSCPPNCTALGELPCQREQGRDRPTDGIKAS